MRTRVGWAEGALEGAVAGAVGTWLMGKATTFMYQKESRQARHKEDAERGGKTAYGVAAEKTAHAAGASLSSAERKQAGKGIHWALGIGTAAAYGAARQLWPKAAAGGGLLFGAAVWLVTDEIAVTALGLTPPPQDFPWQTHARALAGHLVYGGATEAALRGIAAVA